MRASVISRVFASNQFPVDFERIFPNEISRRSKAAERLNGSEILVRALAEEGVEYVFGYPGGSVLNIFDAIYKQDKFKHILVRHEQAAAHAADAYSRASNKVGVAWSLAAPAPPTPSPASQLRMPTAFRW